jgi:hypothetical protein
MLLYFSKQTRMSFYFPTITLRTLKKTCKRCFPLRFQGGTLDQPQN